MTSILQAVTGPAGASAGGGDSRVRQDLRRQPDADVCASPPRQPSSAARRLRPAPPQDAVARQRSRPARTATLPRSCGKTGPVSALTSDRRLRRAGKPPKRRHDSPRMPPMPIDPVALTQALIRRPSVTPADAGAMDVVERGAGRALGFSCRRMQFGEIENLYARHDLRGPNLCFAGHTDVVPMGEAAAWSVDPFAAQGPGRRPHRPRRHRHEERHRGLHRRGRRARWRRRRARLALAADHRRRGGPRHSRHQGGGRGPAGRGREDQPLPGRRADLLRPLRRHDQDRPPRHCRPTSRSRAYRATSPTRTAPANPIPVLIACWRPCRRAGCDEGYQEFQPSNLEVATIDVANPATNVIPKTAKARLNIRFNPTHTARRWATGSGRSGEGRRGLRLARSERGSKSAARPSSRSPATSSPWWRGGRSGGRPNAELSTTGGTSDAHVIRA